jgi:DNA repair protein RadC
MPESLRPREALERMGAENVSDDVLLAIILRSGVRGVNVVDLARNLLVGFGSLTSIATASIEQLAAVKGMGRVKAQVLKASMEMARRLSREQLPLKSQIRSPEDVASIFREEARVLEREYFWVLLLDTKNRVKGMPIDVTRGVASLVHPREVFRPAVQRGAASVILVHNHPSGESSPSPEDIKVTKQLVEAGRLMDIDVLDHIVVGRQSGGDHKWYSSIREDGTVSFGG